MEQDRDWSKLIQKRDATIFGFQLGALEDTLPTPSNRKLWYGTKVDATCKVCKSGQQCSLSHVLARCPIALQQGVQVETRLNSVADLQDSSGSQK